MNKTTSKGMKDPSRKLKKMYREYAKKHEELMVDLLAEVYGEGYRNGLVNGEINYTFPPQNE